MSVVQSLSFPKDQNSLPFPQQLTVQRADSMGRQFVPVQGQEVPLYLQLGLPPQAITPIPLTQTDSDNESTIIHSPKHLQIELIQVGSPIKLEAQNSLPNSIFDEEESSIPGQKPDQHPVEIVVSPRELNNIHDTAAIVADYSLATLNLFDIPSPLGINRCVEINNLIGKEKSKLAYLKTLTNKRNLTEIEKEVLIDYVQQLVDKEKLTGDEIKILKKAHELKHSPASYRLGLYYDSFGTYWNTRLAKKYYKSIGFSDPAMRAKARFRLAHIYYAKASAIRVNPGRVNKKAQKLFTKAERRFSEAAVAAAEQLKFKRHNSESVNEEMVTIVSSAWCSRKEASHRHYSHSAP